MSYTLRERTGVPMLSSLWALATVLSTLAGPFGTHEALGWAPRLAYWSGIVALSVVGSSLCARISRDRVRWKVALIWSGFALLLAAAVHLVNSYVFPEWQGMDRFAYLAAIILATVLVVHGGVALARHAFSPPPDPETHDSQALFLRRLPLDRRAPLIRLEAQDHYLNVVTQNGSALVLLRMQDAVDALQGENGLQVHRSHWVAFYAVSKHRRERGRHFLILTTGEEVPVARSFRPTLKAAGLI